MLQMFKKRRNSVGSGAAFTATYKSLAVHGFPDVSFLLIRKMLSPLVD